ncbi:hypothetical protein DVH24_018329 [Malus domestica]|uniref:Uncharacterized protein n=1 Tax=Malus domestica TaxID=3750 RepID=A0A498KFW7_MALDO|nr:hypothetical protein DVH24_018329 [Malus domestica]
MKRSGMRRSVQRLVRLKRVERVNSCSVSPPETTRSTSVEDKIITSPSPSSLFSSESIFVSFRFHPIPNNT